MSKRNALFVAIVAAVVLALLFLWPEPARADFAVSARIGGGFGGHHVGSRLHHGDGGLRGRVHVGERGLRGRLHLGTRDFRRHRSFRDGRGRGKHDVLLGDRFRHYQHRRIGGGRHSKGALIGDRFRFEQQRRLDEEFLGRDRKRDRHGHKRHDRRHGHRHGRHDGKWLHAAPLLLPYGGADVIVREIIVPVPVPAAGPDVQAERSAVLDPRGRATLVGEEDGIVGDWAPGDVLPDGVPHVTLDHVSYGLAEPPPGQKYARVGNDVLRIDAGTRRIVEVVAR